MGKFQSLEIPEEYKHGIVQGIFNAITNDIPELISEHELPTANGSGLFRWNFINRNIKLNIIGEMQFSILKRGPWKFLLLYDAKTGFTFSVMTESNLIRLQKRRSEGIHYIEALSSVNIGYEPIEEQLRFPGCEVKRDEKMLEELREQLLSEFAGIIRNHILILFNCGYNIVTSARAVLLTPQLEIAYDENWSQYLSKPYYHRNALIADIITDEDEPIVTLKNHPSPVDPAPTQDVALREEEDTADN